MCIERSQLFLACGHTEWTSPSTEPCQRALVSLSQPKRKQGFFSKLLSGPSKRTCNLQRLQTNRPDLCHQCRKIPRKVAAYEEKQREIELGFQRRQRVQERRRHRDSRSLNPQLASDLHSLPGFHDAPIKKQRQIARRPVGAPPLRVNVRPHPQRSEEHDVNERYDLLTGRWIARTPKPRRTKDPASILQDRYDIGAGIWEPPSPQVHHVQPIRPPPPLRRRDARPHLGESFPRLREAPAVRVQIARAPSPLRAQEYLRGPKSPVSPLMSLSRMATRGACNRERRHPPLTTRGRELVRSRTVATISFDEVENSWNTAGLSSRREDKSARFS